jgi:hypothetical protein
MGNEPDLFKTNPPGGVRPASWTEADYIKEWQEKRDKVKTAIMKSCGEDWGSDEKYQWIAPSFAGLKNSLDPLKTWNAGLKNHKAVVLFSEHK